MPSKNKKETRVFITMVKVNSQEAVALLDSGCTTDMLSQELVRIAGIKVYKLTDQVPIQLGTRGSQPKISYSIKTTIKYGPIDMDHYFNVVNIDRYDVILGMVFMRRHGIALNFGMNQVQQGDQVIPALKEGEDEYLQVCRQAMQFQEETDKQEGTSKTDVH
jgi:Retroviral aspartyl protease